MSKFKVGDRVVVVGAHNTFRGQRGEVVEVDSGLAWSYAVRLSQDVWGEPVPYFANELEHEHIYDALSSPALEVDKRPVVGESGPELVDFEEDVINSPSHYTKGKFEVIDIIEGSGVGYRLGNVLKYVLRCDHKHDDNGVQDLKKALWYLNREIEAREAKP